MPAAGLAIGLLSVMLAGCGGHAPPPEERPVSVNNDQSGNEKGPGSLNFHYSNKSTDARMDVDLGTTDVYLEMSGKPVATNGEETGVEEKHPPAQPKAMTPDQSQQRPDPNPQGMQGQGPQRGQDAQQGSQQYPRAEAKRPKPDAMDDKNDPQDDQQGNEDVTGKVLTGIRRAQELFYQKRYPEALDMVRQSIEARPTAEGHALAGSIHYMMGQNGLARRQWQQALRLNPDMPAVVNMLEKTATPGGRGSPFPRPIAARPAPKAPAPVADAAAEAPFPEEYSPDTEAPRSPAQERAPALGQSSAPAPSASPARSLSPVPHRAAPAPAAPPPAPADAVVEPAVQPESEPAASEEAAPAAPAPKTAAQAPAGKSDGKPTPPGYAPPAANQAAAPNASKAAPADSAKAKKPKATLPIKPAAAKPAAAAGGGAQ